MMQNKSNQAEPLDFTEYSIAATALNNIEYEKVEFSTTAYVTGKLRSLTNTIMTLVVLQNAGNFLIR